MFSVLAVLFCICMMVCACSDNESKQATPDANVTIDGALDEDFWEEQKWLTNTYLDGSGNKTIQSTASFGKNGLYFGVTLEDQAVYNDDDGVLQVYFASEEYSSVADGLYRFSFAAGGTAALTKYTESGNFESVTPDDESMPQTAMQRNGAVYNAEIFLPYALFGNTIDSVWFNAAVPVSGSDEWYNFAENEIGGDPLTVNTWWPMNASGLHAYDISIESGEGGQISTTRDYLLPGEKVVFTFNVEDGHYIKALTLNGIDVLGDVREGGGVITYTSPAMNKGIVLKAEFGQMFTVSGTIHYDGAVSEDMNADLSLSLSNDNAAVAVAFDGTNGTFTAEAPAGEYTLTLTSAAEGYVIWSETITVEADKTVDINVGKYEWGEHRIIQLGDSTVTVPRGSGEGEAPVFEGKLNTNKFAFSAFFSIGGGSYMDEQQSVTGLYFRFDNSNIWLNIQLLNWNNTNLTIKDSKAGTGDINLSEAARALEKANGGIYITIFVDGDTVSLWADDGSGTFIKLKEYTVSGLKDARLIEVAQYSDGSIDAERPFDLKDIRIACNAATMAEVYPEIKMQAEYNAEQVTVTGLEGTYAYGDTVTFTAEPQEGYVLIVTYNGQELVAGEGNTYTFTASAMDKITIFAYNANESASGTITLKNDLDLSGLTLMLTGDGEPITATVQDGNTVALSDVALGAYSVSLTVSGVQIPVGNIEIYEASLAAELSVGNISGGSEYAEIDTGAGKVAFKDDLNAESLNLYTVTGLSLTDTIYLRSVWQLSKRTLTAENGKESAPGFIITVGGKSFNIRLLNSGRRQIQLWSGSTWQSNNGNVFESDSYYYQQMMGEGLPVIIELNPKTGEYAVYLQTADSIVELTSNTMPGITNATITGFTVSSWASGAFTFSDIEFIDGLDSYYNNVKAEITCDDDQVNFSGADGTYAYADMIEFTVTAKEGYIITSVTYNGETLDLSADGTYSVICSGIAAKIVVESEEDLTVGLNGAIKYGGSVNTEFNQDVNMTLMAEDGTSALVTFDKESGNYTAKVLPGEYTLTLTSAAEGYVIWSETITVEADKTVDINVGKYEWGEHRIIQLGDSTVTVPRGSGEGEAPVFEGKLNTNKFAFSAFFSIGGGSYMDEQQSVTGLYFRFDNSNIWLNIQLLNWNNTNLTIKDSKAGTGDINLSEAARALEKANGGIYITIFVDGDTVSLWADDGSGTFIKLKEYTVSGLKDARLIEVAQYSDGSIDAERPFDLKDIRIACNAATMAEVYPEIKMQAEYNAEQVTVTGLEGTYAYGDTVTFTAEPQEGYVLIVTYNGQELVAGEGNTYTFTASAMDKITIFANNADETVSG